VFATGRLYDEGSTKEQSMKLAAISVAAASAVVPHSRRMDSGESFLVCRNLLRSQPDSVARRLELLLARTEKSIKCQNAAMFIQARRLEEAVGYVGALRHDHPESQQLQRSVARLLHEAFGSPNWRAAVIDGLGASGE
jgi:hypothetical protein